MPEKKWSEKAHRAALYIAPHKTEVAVIISLSLVVAALGASEPLAMKYIFDRLETAEINALLFGVGILIGINVLRETIGGASNWLTWKVRLGVNAALLEATVSRLHSLPVTYHHQETVGGIMTKLDRGINGFVGAVSEIAFNVLPGVIYLVISLILMFNMDFTLSAVVLVFAPLPALIGMWAAKEQTDRDKKLIGMWTRIFSRFNEVLTGITTVKSFAMEESERKRFMGEITEANGVVLKGVGRDTSVGAIKNAVSIMARISAIAIGGYLAINGEVTIGTLVAFLGYLNGLFGPVQGLTSIYQTLRRATVSLDIIFSILDADSTLDDTPGAKPAGELKGDVIFNKVSFSYKKENPIINGIDIHIRPGEAVALVGPSGAGKTTLTALLQRLYDPTSGSILIDGVDLRDLEQRSLRKQIGVVSQDTLLFNDSIRNNIAYGKPGASIDEIERSAKAANAHSFTMKLPDGYETIIGERGGRLSAGERQRISIARAIIKNPPILILDEATSSLDAESEALVQEALERLMKDRTTFIIAHRLSTVVRADRILVLKNGGIVEEGSHRELVAARGYYASLVERQVSGLIDSAA